MAPPFDKALGHASQPIPTNWNQRDILLYAAGIGAKQDELQFTYELSPNWHAFPTYPLVLGLKLDSTSVNDFSKAKDAGGSTPGLPHMDATKIVHAEQSIEILKQIPAESGPGWKIVKKTVGIKDTGKGLIVDGAIELQDSKGEVYVRMISSSYAFGKYTKKEDGTEGYAKSVAPKQPVKGGKPPAREPDHVMSEKTLLEQAMLYRLSGDYNPLHHDGGKIGRSLGFKGAILHGLCSYGHAARALVLKVANGDGTRLKYMSARFSSPVMPGDELETSMWVSDDAASGGIRVDFTQKVKNTGKVCLQGGVALFAKEGSRASKL
ncbi:hypothetical protein OIV83_002096 [Microbotryomycetes sp. JL201]|nr:hypothetical protein OIV83_002096 [Microbotryomycetes sp. JL201]